MTSVSITQHKDGRAFVEVDGKRLARVMSVTLTLAAGQRHPVVEIIQEDGLSKATAYANRPVPSSPPNLL